MNEKPELWQTCADAVLSVQHELIKAGFKLSWESVKKINKVVRECAYTDNSQ